MDVHFTEIMRLHPSVSKVRQWFVVSYHVFIVSTQKYGERPSRFYHVIFKIFSRLKVRFEEPRSSESCHKILSGYYLFPLVAERRCCIPSPSGGTRKGRGISPLPLQREGAGGRVEIVTHSRFRSSLTVIPAFSHWSVSEPKPESPDLTNWEGIRHQPKNHLRKTLRLKCSTTLQLPPLR